jgi:DNA modification methylase
MPEGYKTFSREFPKQNNPFPESYTNKIVVGDSVSVLKNIPDNSVDLVFTSPPYNFGMGYDTHDDQVDWKLYFDMLWQIFDECIRIVKYGGRIIVNTQPLFSEYIPSHHLISQGFLQRGLIWKAEILWEKNHRNCAYTAWGSWRSPSGPYFKYTWEYLEVFCKGDIKHTGDSSLIDITGNEFKTWVDARWSIAPERNMKEYGHPAMFPPELAYRVLRLFTYRDDVVVDPFNGAGTTTLVAERLGRRYLGVDLSAEYCATAEKRILEEPLKDYSAILDAKLAEEGRDKSLKERGEIPHSQAAKSNGRNNIADQLFVDSEQ